MVSFLRDLFLLPTHANCPSFFPLFFQRLRWPEHPFCLIYPLSCLYPVPIFHALVSLLWRKRLVHVMALCDLCRPGCYFVKYTDTYICVYIFICRHIYVCVCANYCLYDQENSMDSTLNRIILCTSSIEKQRYGHVACILQLLYLTENKRLIVIRPLKSSDANQFHIS